MDIGWQQNNDSIGGFYKMKAVLKVKCGYLNIDNGIKIYKSKEKATVLPISKVSSQKEEIYKEKPMIGKIDIEIIKR